MQTKKSKGVKKKGVKRIEDDLLIKDLDSRCGEGLIESMQILPNHLINSTNECLISILN